MCETGFYWREGGGELSLKTYFEIILKQSTDKAVHILYLKV